MERHAVTILCLMLFPAMLFAQSVKTIRGEYVYHVPENIPLDRAKVIAVERARIAALAEEFGTVISHTSTTSTTNINEESDVVFLSTGVNEVKGEWLKDVREPEIEVLFENGMFAVTAKVWGEAREIKAAGVDVETSVLRNGTTLKFAGTDFTDGDNLYLYFKSPVSGYLAAYLTDNERAWCLLPYMQESSGCCRVDGGRDYCFFSIDAAADTEKNKVDEYVLTCGTAPEYNNIYVMFSMNPFTKAADMQMDESLPRELSLEDFLEWQSRCRVRDKSMVVEKISVVVSPR